MKRFFQFSLFLLTLVIAGCRPDVVRPFNQQTATQVQRFGDDMVASSTQFLKGFPIEISAAPVYLQGFLPVPPALGSSRIGTLDADDCGLAANDPRRLDADSDGIQANYDYTFNCSSASYRGFPAVLTGRVQVVDLADNDPTSGYDVTITNLKLEYTNAAGKPESVVSSQTTKLVKLPSGDYSVNQDFVFGSLVDGVPSGYRRNGTLTYSPLGSSNADRFAKGLLNGTTDFTFVENLEVRNYTLVTQDLRVDQNKCGRDLAVDSGALRFEYATGDKLTWTVQDTNSDGNSCGEGVWTYNTTPLPDVAPASFNKPLQIGNSSVQTAEGIATDSSRNSYVVLTTSAGLNGESGIGADDVALVKINSVGTVVWTRIIGTVAADYAAGVAIGSDGTVLVAGTTVGAFPNFTSGGGRDGFVAFYNSAGVLQRVKQFGGAENQTMADIAVDSSNGDIVIAATTQTLGNFNLLLTKFAADGSDKWSEEVVSNAGEFAEDVAVDSSGNVYAVGTVSTNFLSNTSFGGSDIFLIKYDSAGVRQWARQYGTNADECGFALTTFSSDYIFLSGCTKGAFSGFTNAGNKDIFLMKIEPSGSQTWVRQFGTSGNDEGRAVIADLTRIYVTGSTEGNLNGNTNLGTTSASDAFVAEFSYDSNAVLLLATKQVGSTGFDSSYGIDFGLTNTILVAGFTDGTLGDVPKFGSGDGFVIPVLKTP